MIDLTGDIKIDVFTYKNHRKNRIKSYSSLHILVIRTANYATDGNITWTDYWMKFNSDLEILQGGCFSFQQ